MVGRANPRGNRSPGRAPTGAPVPAVTFAMFENQKLKEMRENMSRSKNLRPLGDFMNILAKMESAVTFHNKKNSKIVPRGERFWTECKVQVDCFIKSVNDCIQQLYASFPQNDPQVWFRVMEDQFVSLELAAKQCIQNKKCFDDTNELTRAYKSIIEATDEVIKSLRQQYLYQNGITSQSRERESSFSFCSRVSVVSTLVVLVSGLILFSYYLDVAYYRNASQLRHRLDLLNAKAASLFAWRPPQIQNPFEEGTTIAFKDGRKAYLFDYQFQAYPGGTDSKVPVTKFPLSAENDKRQEELVAYRQLGKKFFADYLQRDVRQSEITGGISASSAFYQYPHIAKMAVEYMYQCINLEFIQNETSLEGWFEARPIEFEFLKPETWLRPLDVFVLANPLETTPFGRTDYTSHMRDMCFSRFQWTMENYWYLYKIFWEFNSLKEQLELAEGVTGANRDAANRLQGAAFGLAASYVNGFRS